MSDPVVLTGGTGFVGRAVLADLVARGVLVVASFTHAPGPDLPGVTWVQADILTEKGRAVLAEKAARMIHCAWEVEHGAFWTSPANALWRAASVDLAARFLAAGGQRLLALGTCAEYDTAAPGPWDETRALAPATIYGQHKAGLFCDLTDLLGERLIWARLFHLYGPGEDARRLIPSLLSALRAGRPAEVRASGLIRDFCSTPHLARCLVGLLEHSAQGAFDIGCGQPRSLGDLASLLADLTGRPDLLRLSHTPGPADPAVMAPALTRLRAVLGPVSEDPAQGLARLVAAG
jgi:nucleoside-diphosphate-sugar epimerase